MRERPWTTALRLCQYGSGDWGTGSARMKAVCSYTGRCVRCLVLHSLDHCRRARQIVANLAQQKKTKTGPGKRHGRNNQQEGAPINRVLVYAEHQYEVHQCVLICRVLLILKRDGCGTTIYDNRITLLLGIRGAYMRTIPALLRIGEHIGFSTVVWNRTTAVSAKNTGTTSGGPLLW